MPTPTYVALAKTVLTGNQATITFSGIVNTYTDLLLTISARTDRATWVDNIQLQVNSVAVGNYSQTDIYAYGPTAYSNRLITTNNQLARLWGSDAATATSNTFASFELYFPNYTGTTQKVILLSNVMENNSTADFQLGGSALLANVTSAITTFTLSPQYGTNFVSGSRFDLYGIKNS
jgi:hypothetical protein